MGDINFEIFKNVDLNKTVTLDINKDVTVNVNNPDQLATAEADAEAFGPNALAEVDAYTLVTPTEAFAYAESTAALDNVVRRFNDPLGDTFGNGPLQLDIESVSGTVSGGNLILEMEFFTPISAPSTFNPNSVVGYWDLDLDQDPLTGIPSAQSVFAPPGQQGGPLGVDVFVDLFSEVFNPGFVDLVDPFSGVIGTAPITYGTDSFKISIPLALLGDDGNLNYGTVIGTFPEPTDAAPNTVFGTVVA